MRVLTYFGLEVLAHFRSKRSYKKVSNTHRAFQNYANYAVISSIVFYAKLCQYSCYVKNLNQILLDGPNSVSLPTPNSFTFDLAHTTHNNSISCLNLNYSKLLKRYYQLFTTSQQLLPTSYFLITFRQSKIVLFLFFFLFCFFF